MEPSHLSVRAVVFDIYGTLLEVGPPPPDADAAWESLYGEFFDAKPPLSRLEFSIACNQVIARHHETARARRIPWPEVPWPSVVAEVLPALARLEVGRRDDFLFRQMQTGRATHMTAETAAMLRWLEARRSLLGIASNAQAYTLRELQHGLEANGLGLDLFQPDLRFWSFEHGFSKPDPHVFQVLSARLAARQIAPFETLMVGDRPDNDISPAQAHGWQTWHLASSATAAEGGDWSALRRRLTPGSAERQQP